LVIKTNNREIITVEPARKKNRIVSISGRERVESLRITDKRGREKELACDDVLFTGCFTPKAVIPSKIHLLFEHRRNAPEAEDNGRCSDPAYIILLVML